MESGQKIEAGESKTHSISNTGEVTSIPIKKLLSSLSSASFSSIDSSFELIVNGNGDFISPTSDSLKNNELHVAGHPESEFQFISGHGIGLPGAAKISSRSLSRSSSSASESSLHDHVIELPKPGKYEDIHAKPGEADSLERRKNAQTCSSTSSSSESESEHKIKLQQGGGAKDKDNGQSSPVTPTHRISSGSSSEAATQYPPTQMMDRTDDPTSSSYRIPSHVFSRTKSTAPMEWSAASNESLFSIQMGTMSFTREQMYWQGKSGELYRPGESALDVSQHLTMKPSDYGLIGTHPGGDMAVTEARAAATMREVIRENQRTASCTLTESSSQSASISPQSESSAKSFQFPILTEDGTKSISFKGEDLQNAKQEGKPESPQPSSNPQTSKESSSDESPKAAANGSPKRWGSCFSCCPLCS